MLKDTPRPVDLDQPAYAPLKFTSSQHRVHAFDKKKGWGDRVDKQHHLKQDAFMAHADKCLQLGEKPFVSGGMKLTERLIARKRGGPTLAAAEYALSGGVR